MSGRTGVGGLAAVAGLRTGRARFGAAIAAPRPLERVEGLLAGAAVADLTPPPGMPKAGYSANAHDGEGFRSRLRARVVHLRSGAGSVAIVHGDLLGGSSVVQYLVAERIAERTDVPLAGLMIGATHTHAGPGQFSGSDFYNRFASNRSGFDPAWTRFLVERISDAVIRSVENRRPAVAAWGTADVWGATRNRSLDPHVTNETVADKRMEPQRKFAAINPGLDLLRVDDAITGEPIGTSVIFSVHGTGISQHSREYNADLWAYVVDELAARVEAETGHRGVIGAIEGTHADVAPALYPGMAGYRDAKRVGSLIGAAAGDLWVSLGAHLTSDLPLRCAFEEVPLAGGARRGGVQVAKRPAVGAALVAGAKENTTPIVELLPGFRAGMPRTRPRGPHGAKRVLGGRLQPLVVPTKTFPRSIPVQLLGVGDRVVVGLPFEVTVESGRRIAAEAGRRLSEAGAPADRVVVSSVANEYCGYLTTPEEYSRQHYEGGHTLWGPNQLPFVTGCVAELADALGGVDADLPVVQRAPSSRTWDLRVRRWLADAAPLRSDPASEGSPRFRDYTDRVDGAWEWVWVDGPPGSLTWHRTLVRVESSADGGATWQPAVHRGRRVDDGGTEMEVRHLGETERGHRYLVRWYDPNFDASLLHRFVVVDPEGGTRLVSPAFS